MNRPSLFLAVSLTTTSMLNAMSYTAAVQYLPTANTANPFLIINGSADSIVNGHSVAAGAGGAGPIYHPLVASTDGTLNDLSPGLTGFSYYFDTATDGVHQVGYGVSTDARADLHAFSWSGSAGSAVDLNPAGAVNSVANAVFANQQVGAAAFSTANGTNHAMLWTGTAASAVDLTPAGAIQAVANGTNGVHQVGFMQSASYPGLAHAAMWSGNAGSVVDLNPTNLDIHDTQAVGVGGNEQVGYGDGNASGGASTAMLWESSGSNTVNLGPAGSSSSEAYETNGTQQAGFVTNGGGNTTAALWAGSSDSVINLQNLLPTSINWQYSYACSIDASGNVWGIADATPPRGADLVYLVEWSPVAGSTSVTVGSSQSNHFTANNSGGIVNRSIAGLTINAGASATVDAVSNHSNRQLLTVLGGGLTLAGTTGNWTSLLDLTNNDLQLPGASLAMVVDQIHQGFNDGKWNGSGGITSSSAAADPLHLGALGVLLNDQNGTPLFNAAHLFDGIEPAPGDVLVKYTYVGDANLDGKVDGSDYSLLDNGYLTHATGWYNGDFNYDGVVNGSDYTLIDNAFNRQGAQLAARFAENTSQIATVPEPAMTGLLVITAIAKLRRRRPTRASF